MRCISFIHSIVLEQGAAFADGKLVYNLLDGHTVAVDAATGAQIWRTKVVDVAIGATITMAPIVVKDMVIVGSSGGGMGVRGFLAALDLGTGKERWRAYNLGPDADVKITERFAPFYDHDRGVNLGATSWPGEAWKVGGGGVWGWLWYDPELDLVYYGTANPGPWNP
jgi:glucose dehydrogenase